MDSKIQARFEARAIILKSLAHPTRLFIVDVLSQEKKCVCELTELIGADMSTVSKHLSILKNAGIVQSEKHYSQVFYSLRMPCVCNFFGCIESVMNMLAEEQRELVG